MKEKTHTQKKAINSPIKGSLLNNVKWRFVILAIILGIGFFGIFFLPAPFNTPGRVHNIDSPSIGYHNMKENEYLGEALNQWRDGDYLRRKINIEGLDSGPGYFEEYPQPPLLPWMFISIWIVTGVQFWSARLIIILFSVATIPVLYLLVKKLTDETEYIALMVALIYSILPLAVFFGRNIQPEAPALFFLLLGQYFYVKWIDDFKTNNIVFSGIALMICAMFKPTFLIGIIPLIFIFPFNKIILKGNADGKTKEESWKGRKKLVVQMGLFIVCFLPYFIWNWITAEFLNTKETLLEGTAARVDVFRIFTSSYWTEYGPSIISYIDTNYAIWFLGLALIGLIFLLLKYRSRLSKFCLGYTIAIIPYGMILADYINQHSYYQMPFVPLVCICSAYCLYSTGMYLKDKIRIKHIQYIPLVVLLFTLPAVAEFTNAQYDTIYFGMDVGAKYLNSHMAPEDRFFVEGGPQSFGVCYNADRRCAEVTSLSDLKMAEQNLNFTAGFIEAADGGLDKLKQKPELFDYIQKNYRVTQYGFVPRERNGSMYYYLQYIIVQKGGSCDLNSLAENNLQNSMPYLSKTYIISNGSVSLYTVSQ